MPRRLLAPALTAAALAISGGAPAAAAPGIQAHRGGSVLNGVPTYPENTMPAFEHAARAGYVLEMDAKLTRDRVPVVLHDDTLDRTTDCTGRVAAKTLEQLKACRADVLGSPGGVLGSRPTAPKVGIPTVAEVLAFARREGAWVSLEIKNVPGDSDFDPTPAFANRVMDAVVASGIPRRQLVVQSFWPANLDVAEAHLPGVATSYLTLASYNDSGPAVAAGRRWEWVSPQWPVGSAYVRRAHGLSRRVVPYTLDLAGDVRAAAAAGVDALITDDPAMAQRTLGLGRRDLVPDALRPVVRLSAPTLASDHSRSRRFRVRWRGRDRGSGIARYRLEVRRNGEIASRWHRLRVRRGRRSARFRGRPGATYLFRLRARDRFGNLSRFAYDTTVVPRDDRTRRLRLGAGWRRIRRGRAYGHTLTRACRAGRVARIAFRGTRVALVARRTRHGARLLVSVDGRRKLVSLRGRERFRRTVFRSRGLRPGLHRLRIVTVSRGIADLDAVGVETGGSPPRG